MRRDTKTNVHQSPVFYMLSSQHVWPHVLILVDSFSFSFNLHRNHVPVPGPNGTRSHKVMVTQLGQLSQAELASRLTLNCIIGMSNELEAADEANKKGGARYSDGGGCLGLSPDQVMLLDSFDDIALPNSLRSKLNGKMEERQKRDRRETELLECCRKKRERTEREQRKRTETAGLPHAALRCAQVVLR